VGVDRGYEVVTLLNTTHAPIDLTGWRLVDSAGAGKDLSGLIGGGAVVQVTAEPAPQLGNRGDTLVLIDPRGGPIDKVTYHGGEVRPGRTLCFSR
jgi:hypothetical protein